MIERLPGTFWGVIIDSFFSLGGVVLTNLANDRRLRAQLDHDRQIKDRDRELSLRKDVYLAAAEAISAGFVAVARFANLDVPHEQITASYMEKSPSIAKVHVIAKGDTIKAVATFAGELAAVYLRLLARRVPLVARKEQVALLGQQIASFGNERDRLVDLLKHHNLEGSADQRRQGIIERNFLF